MDIFFLPTLTKVVPKGKYQQQLQKEGRVQEVPSLHMYDENQVKEVIRTSSKNNVHVGKEWTVLEVVNKNTLKILPHVKLTAEFAIERRGGIYLCDKDPGPPKGILKTIP